jgi:hypothetical protein
MNTNIYPFKSLVDINYKGNEWYKYVENLAKLIQVISNGNAVMEYVGDVPFVFIHYKTLEAYENVKSQLQN